MAVDIDREPSVRRLPVKGMLRPRQDWLAIEPFEQPRERRRDALRHVGEVENDTYLLEAVRHTRVLFRTHQEALQELFGAPGLCAAAPPAPDACSHAYIADQIERLAVGVWPREYGVVEVDRQLLVDDEEFGVRLRPACCGRGWLDMVELEEVVHLALRAEHVDRHHFTQRRLRGRLELVAAVVGSRAHVKIGRVELAPCMLDARAGRGRLNAWQRGTRDQRRPRRRAQLHHRLLGGRLAALGRLHDGDDHGEAACEEPGGEDQEHVAEGEA